MTTTVPFVSLQAVFTYESLETKDETRNRSFVYRPTIQEFDNSSWPNVSALPKELQFTDDNLVSVIAYTCLFIVAAVGNLTVFITLFRNRNRKSRVNLFIMHLSIADLMVTFIMLPLETAWHITVEWNAGDAMCRILMFFRAFGFYLSSFILVVISLDRYFAILYPLSLNDADKRGKIMLALAWVFSGVASIPQSIIFHVEIHPIYRWFKQCVTFNSFPTKKHELAYNLFSAITVYGLPLIIISGSYLSILWKISKKTKESRAELRAYPETVRSKLRRSGVGNIAKARARTLKMTVVIVLVFIVCWTPYFVISAWWWFARDSFKKIDPKVRRGLLLFAVSNSCMDPIVYGMFTIKFKQEFQRCCCCLRRQFTFRKYLPTKGMASGLRREILMRASADVRPKKLSHTFTTHSLSSTNSAVSHNTVVTYSDPAVRSHRDPDLRTLISYSARINRNNFVQCS